MGPLTESQGRERLIREQGSSELQFLPSLLSVLIPYREWVKKMLLIPEHKQ